ncbi:hypothetical protein [Pseudactinotalea terrae]|uniref:hypothetical protein n=1 Tax=Pseudactinotalea terrae TaxID=1743262 RepID=UPI0012E1E062|nr:hypothetical protein [Pseudactinotalea terrae]
MTATISAEDTIATVAPPAYRPLTPSGPVMTPVVEEYLLERELLESMVAAIHAGGLSALELVEMDEPSGDIAAALLQWNAPEAA